MKLYELTDIYTGLMSLLESAETEEEVADVLNELTAVEEEISDKAEAYARIMRNAQAEADALRAEEKRLAAKREKQERAIERLKNHLHYAMGIAGATELKTSIGRFKVALNPPSAVVVDMDAVPERFLIAQPPKVDKKAIIAEWKETGEIFPGVDIQRTEGVRFR